MVLGATGVLRVLFVLTFVYAIAITGVVFYLSFTGCR